MDAGIASALRANPGALRGDGVLAHSHPDQERGHLQTSCVVPPNMRRSPTGGAGSVSSGKPNPSDGRGNIARLAHRPGLGDEPASTMSLRSRLELLRRRWRGLNQERAPEERTPPPSA